MAKSRAAVTQPKFDSRITDLKFLESGGRLKRGYMIWEKPITGYSDKAKFNFLYNPSTVEATYYMSTPGVSASLLFPNANDTSDLRVPLNQTVEWSVLFDRTYELWGSYKADGQPRGGRKSPNNNPGQVGVLADIYQMQQFTGMNVAYEGTGVRQAISDTNLGGRQGIMQLIPSYVYFGDTLNLAYYGYITEWDVTITHWTQYMVPMRCVIDIDFTMLPPPKNTTTITGGTASTRSPTRVSPPGLPLPPGGVSGR